MEQDGVTLGTGKYNIHGNYILQRVPINMGIKRRL